LVERGQAYDVERANGALVETHSFTPIAQQTRAIGATWLDRQLIDGSDDFSMKGFGAAARQGLAEREAFLVEQGLAERRGSRVILARDLLATLRNRELDTVAQVINAETALTSSLRSTANSFPASIGARSRSRAGDSRCSTMVSGSVWCRGDPSSSSGSDNHSARSFAVVMCRGRSGGNAACRADCAGCWSRFRTTPSTVNRRQGDAIHIQPQN
jgi:hypothetical protein